MSVVRPCLSRVAVLLCLLSVFVFATSTVLAKRAKNKLDIEPGPTTMSLAEKAIVAEPDKGIEHAVILVEESSRDDTFGSGYRLAYHLRAKILSNEARDLGDITVPLVEELGTLSKFWAVVIKPDGTMQKFGKGLLKRQTIAEVQGYTATMLKAALPGVEPGCVIDFGYKLSNSMWFPADPVALQRDWPVRLIRYRWRPYQEWPAAYFITGPEDFAVDIDQSKSAILITAKNVPPHKDEKYSPPEFEVRPHFVPYYRRSNKAGIDYWHETSLRDEEELKDFCGSSSKRKKALAEIGIPTDLDLERKTRFLYDWILENIDNPSFRTAEEEAEAALKKLKTRVVPVEELRDLLKQRRGSRRQITLTFTGLARELGAEAHIVKAVDRTRRYFKPGMLSQQQFSVSFVELRLPGAGTDEPLRLDPADAMPYGQLPWWITGLTGIRSTPKGAETAKIPMSGHDQNRIVTRTTIEFIDDNETMAVNWSRRATGQALLSRRRSLREMAPDKLDERLRELCGEDARFEVDSATTGDLKPLAGGYELTCSGERFTAGLDEDTDKYLFSFDGQWIRSVLDLDPGPRAQQVNLPYCWTEQNEILVQAPVGFAPGQAPKPVKLDNPFGRYSLTARKSEDGYLIRREYVVKRPVIAAQHYPALAEFLEAIRQADDIDLEFVRTAGDES